MGGRLEKSFRLCVCAPVTINLRVGTGKCLVSLSEFVFIFALHSLHSVWSHYACCFHRLLGQELFSFFLLFIYFFLQMVAFIHVVHKPVCIIFPSRYHPTEVFYS